jgi:hypothetical protein
MNEIFIITIIGLVIFILAVICYLVMAYCLTDEKADLQIKEMYDKWLEQIKNK